jgi:rare lipoprotein A
MAAAPSAQRVLLALALALAACAHEATHPFNAPAVTHADGPPSSLNQGFPPPGGGGPRPAAPDQVGLATWYGSGKRTANGERFDPRGMTAAHRRLPFGTWVEVRRRDTGRSVRVRINDRGPFGDDRRVIDLARGAAEQLGIVADGVVEVEVYVVSGP